MLNSEQELKEKIYGMFILGYEGESPEAHSLFMKALDNGLGGVIFFTENITGREQFKKAVSVIKLNARCKPFLSIDQEGGRVERTLNLYGGSHYLSARESALKGEDFVRAQTKQIARELRDFGLNMNFAPVLDVDTNPDNPVIAERSYSSDPEIVAKFGKIAVETYLENGIIPVGKHFPGHGDTAVDSHLALPVTKIKKRKLESVHVAPFRALSEDLPAMMIAHVHYPCFDEERIPASLSKNVISKYLRKTLNYNGVVVSDDMEMGGIKDFPAFEACKLAIEAGVNMFIFRNSDFETLRMIEDLVSCAATGGIDLEKIDESAKRINNLRGTL